MDTEVRPNEIVCVVCGAKPSKIFRNGKMEIKKLDKNLVCDSCEYLYKEKSGNFVRNNLTKVKNEI